MFQSCHDYSVICHDTMTTILTSMMKKECRSVLSLFTYVFESVTIYNVSVMLFPYDYSFLKG